MPDELRRRERVSMANAQYPHLRLGTPVEETVDGPPLGRVARGRDKRYSGQGRRFPGLVYRAHPLQLSPKPGQLGVRCQARRLCVVAATSFRHRWRCYKLLCLLKAPMVPGVAATDASSCVVQESLT
ncbi:hypothetical protein BHE74_00021582 [Ensete ventricosum]|nr:hypothetical protein BHE74_00021582 [Ensete ventricosum]